MKKVILSIAVVIVTVIAVFMLTRLENDDLGEIQFVLIDRNDTVVIDDTLSFTEEDDLVSLLQEHYTVVCANTSYKPTTRCETHFANGRIVLGVDEVITDWRNHYIGIYINDTYSNVGVDGIALKDGDTITFEEIMIGADD
ncbi:MAG: hypothetical protein UMR38_04270 [Candidatus Izemoplasma sp.]|nr:hypothetical protein [Candidatus Izemoplasma sp.]